MSTAADRVLSDPNAPFVAELSHVPRAARWLLPVSAMLRRGTPASTLERRLRALVTLRMAAIDAADHWLAQQRVVAAELGIDPTQIEALASGAWQDHDGFSARERAALRWTDGMAVNEAKRDRDGFAALQEHFDTAEIVELTTLVGLCAFVDRVANALELPVGGPARVDVASPLSDDDLVAWAATMFEPGAT